MSGLVARNGNGENISYSGSRFEGLGSLGGRRLCVRTGSGEDGVVRYGLTTEPLNDKYKALRMRIPDHPGGDGGKYAYIAQNYTVSASESTSQTCTSSRVSNYVSSTTLTTASRSELKTGNATRASTHAPIYYGASLFTMTTTGTIGRPQISGSITVSTNAATPANGKFMSGSSATSYASSTRIGAHTQSVNWSRGNSRYNTASMTYSIPVYNATRTQTSRVSNYVSSTTLTTASRSELKTGNATRSSTYNTSSSTTTSASRLSNNVNI